MAHCLLVKLKPLSQDSMDSKGLWPPQHPVPEALRH